MKRFLAFYFRILNKLQMTDFILVTLCMILHLILHVIIFPAMLLIRSLSKLIWHQLERDPVVLFRVFEVYPSKELWWKSISSCSVIQSRNVEYLVTRPSVQWYRYVHMYKDINMAKCVTIYCRIATMNGIIVAPGKHVLVMRDYTYSSVRGYQMNIAI